MQRAPELWIKHVERVLHGYDEDLLRKVAVQLFRPRNSWPADELIDRTLSTLNNPPALDRRLKDLAPAPRALLVFMARSRQPHWPVAGLVELMTALGEPDGLAPVYTLLESGLLFPEGIDGDASPRRLRSFEQWLSSGSPSAPPAVFAHPQVLARIREEHIALPEPVAPVANSTLAGPAQEADGLEWPLRLAVLWQHVRRASLRRTQQGDLFKRDLDRLRGDPLLAAAPSEALAPLPDPGLLALSWALQAGLLHEEDIEIHADDPNQDWLADLPSALSSLWSAAFQVRSWNAEKGWQPLESPAHPHAAAYLLAMTLLAELPDDSWARARDVEDWVLGRHPYWKDREPPAKPKTRARPAPAGPGLVQAFLLGVAYPLRLVQAARDPDGDGWLLRLSSLGKWVLGLTDAAPPAPTFPQTLLVQPNLEILAYRQGLSPSLIFRLGKFATWKTLGAACTLQLEPDSVYQAMEGGESAAAILQLLEAHGMKSVPAAVIESLKTWSNKRDRISIYPTGALLEFPSPAELADALSRGVPALRISDRLALVPTEKDIDYRHFRLTGTRDYHLPPEKCVAVDADGVTLNVDLARSDLLLETEIVRFAEPVPGLRHLYRITPASVAAARNLGLSLADLESWFSQRTTGPISPAARLLFAAALAEPAAVRRQFVLHLTSSDLVDGLLQWPTTRPLILDRLGPKTVTLAEENLPTLRAKLAEIGMTLNIDL